MPSPAVFFICRKSGITIPVSKEHIFRPPQRLGLILHAALTLLLVGGTIAGLWGASRATIGPLFLLGLLPILVTAVGAPVLVYRGYALSRAHYILQRDGIRLHWGLRVEHIPMTAVEWVRPASELRQPLPRPVLQWPGAVLGVRHLPEGIELEYLAADPAQR